MLSRSFGVKVTMHYGIAIDLFPLKRHGLKSWGLRVRNDVTPESYVLENYRSAFILVIYRKNRDLEGTRIGILQYTPEPITNKIGLV